MMKLEYLLLALAGGGLGSLIGGIQIFIITGFVGLVAVLGNHGLLLHFHTQPLLIPAVIFNGAVVATAYASKKYQFIFGSGFGNIDYPFLFLNV